MRPTSPRGGADFVPMTLAEALKLTSPPPDHGFAYGPEPEQFGHLRLPKSPGPHPVAIVIHGGCWRGALNLHFIGSLAHALAGEGIATWNIEYRRVGDSGGGWPGTFVDVARGAAHLRKLARRFDLDLNRVAAVGHSAGGHLALWLAGRKALTKFGAKSSLKPVRLRGVVSLAGVSDLRRARKDCSCFDIVERFMGGSAKSFPERYRMASPAEMLPLGVPQRLIHGARDGSVPLKMSVEYAAAARSHGDDVRLTVLPYSGHFELIAPKSPAWKIVLADLRELLAD